MARVIAALMRHGRYQQPPDTPSAHLPHPLTMDGESEARDGAGELIELCQREGWKIDPVIDTSSLLRAWQTANVVAEELSKNFRREYSVEQFHALMERSMGAGANLTLDEIASAVEGDPRFEALPEGWKREPFFRPPLHGAESLMEAGARVHEHVLARTSDQANRSDDYLKVFIGHSGCFRHVAVHLGALSVEQVRSTTMAFGSVIVFEQIREGWEQIAGSWDASSR